MVLSCLGRTHTSYKGQAPLSQQLDKAALILRLAIQHDQHSQDVFQQLGWYGGDDGRGHIQYRLLEPGHRAQACRPVVSALVRLEALFTHVSYMDYYPQID